MMHVSKCTLPGTVLPVLLASAHDVCLPGSRIDLGVTQSPSMPEASAREHRALGVSESAWKELSHLEVCMPSLHGFAHAGILSVLGLFFFFNNSTFYFFPKRTNRHRKIHSFCENLSQQHCLH
ncbi:UNVERIFIED_CONTAM: hypothetical protein K2H54_054977 [Gekko kuhli]